ncbi:hypothetical protein [Fischerella sp. JS2]|nr:hypothetical protein [Fischerella sp. JS2]
MALVSKLSSDRTTVQLVLILSQKLFAIQPGKLPYGRGKVNSAL